MKEAHSGVLPTWDHWSGDYRVMRLLRVCIGLSVAATAWAEPFDQRHTALETVLATYVKDGLVDYAALKKHREGLDGYLARTARVGRTAFDGWTRKQQLAFLINVYNGTTLQLIIDHYPVASIRDIGSFLRGPWRQPSVHLFGGVITLNDLEHGLIRRRFKKPRIHFALVCAARGCPPLRGHAYTGTELDTQLDEQARIFLRDTRKNRLDRDGGFLYLSPILKWYGKDFGVTEADRIEYLRQYLRSEDRAWLAGRPVRLRYTDYDWSLNDR